MSKDDVENKKRFLTREAERYIKDGVYLIFQHPEHVVHLMKDVWSLQRSRRCTEGFLVVAGIGVLEDKICWNLLKNLNRSVFRVDVNVCHEIVCRSGSRVWKQMERAPV